jgi:P4 family phage/plasmid primase-like protien
MLTPDGRPFVRVKFRTPTRIGDNVAKYASPAKGGLHAYILPGIPQAAETGMLLVTEGEKKAIAACHSGIPTIGLIGVFGFLDGATKDLHADLHPYVASNRQITFVVDSDAAVNYDIAFAAHRFNQCAVNRQCDLRVRVLPPSFSTTDQGRCPIKVGLDDLLVQNGVDCVRDVLATAPRVEGTVDDLYVAWLLEFARVCIAKGVKAATIADDIARKGFFDKLAGGTRRRILGELERVFPGLGPAILEAIRTRLAAEFRDVAAPAHGGVNLAVGNKVTAPGFDDSLNIDALDADIAWCFLPNSNYASRPFPRKLLELAPARSASAQNGMAGGRPRGPSVTDITNACLAQPKFTRDGICLLRILNGQWHLYNGTHYVPIKESDVSGQVMQFLRQHPLYSDQATTKMQTDVMNQIRAHDAAGLPSGTQPPIWLTPGGATPADGWLATRGRLVNIDAVVRALGGEAVVDAEIARDPTPLLFSTWAVDYAFDPAASCPRFQRFLVEILPDPEVREGLQMMVGLCLVPDTSYNVFFMLQGLPGTGKSTFLHMLLALVGNANTCHVPFSKFADKFSIGLLTEKLVNLLGEGDTELPRDAGLGRIEGVLKDLTDGGILPVERKFHEPGMARGTARCVAAANFLPTFYDRSNGLWDRLRVIPFEVVKRGAVDEDRCLRETIVATEMPGVLNWALDGLAKLRKLQRFPESRRGLELKQQHRRLCDHEAEFLVETYVADPGTAPIARQDVYREYRSWMGQRNYHALGEGKFAQNLQRAFPNVAAKTVRGEDQKQFRAWMGLRKLEGAP